MKSHQLLIAGMLVVLFVGCLDTGIASYIGQFVSARVLEIAAAVGGKK